MSENVVKKKVVKNEKASKSKAHIRYFKSDGITPVPGTTTITGQLDEGKSGGMAYRAWEFGMKGLDYKVEWAKKTDSGSLCHYLVDCDNKNIQADQDHVDEFSKVVIEKAETGMLGWLDYKKEHISEIIASELPLVDDFLGFGGMVDTIARDKQGRLGLIDIKTGKVYESTKYQIAPYEYLWNTRTIEQIRMIVEERGGILNLKVMEKIEWKTVVQIDKDTGLITPIPYEDLSAPLEIFKHLLAIYYLKKKPSKKAWQKK